MKRAIQLLTNKEYAELYGVHVNTVLRWVHEGAIPIYYCSHSAMGAFKRYFLNPLDVPYGYEKKLPETQSDARYTRDGHDRAKDG